jgi:hypothetical protein
VGTLREGCAMKENTNISLQLLLLNDLLHTNIIDKDLYDRAAQKITTLVNITKTTDAPVILATA